MENQDSSWVGRIVAKFLEGNLAILLVIISLLAGAVALVVTPREEEPQIVVPFADIFVQYPGGSAEEVEKRVSSRLEKLLYEIDGVEYVYSMSRPGLAIVTVRFFVGQDREDSLLKLYSKIQANIDRVTPGITGWVVKPVEIDDVPIVTAALYSERYGDDELYRMGEELLDKIQALPNTAKVSLFGGRRREVRVQLDPDRLAAYGLTAHEVRQAVTAWNVQAPAGAYDSANTRVVVETGRFVEDPREVAELMIGLYDDRPVYLHDVADVLDGPAERASYTRFGLGSASERIPHEQLLAGGTHGSVYPAVTLAVAKKKGTNAVWVANAVEKRLEELRRDVLPADVAIRITRNYGETANDKVNELVEGLAIAVLTVIGLIAVTMGWREGIVVAVAVPITYSLTLLVNYMAGYTINRVTLFALTLALGLLVDDPIVDVENIHRHLQMRKHPPLKAVLIAVNEVRPPIILATLAVIASFIPLFFITGMMGPYMRPMALNVPLTMLMSMFVAFTITPWLSYHMLKGVKHGGEEAPEVTRSAIYRVYSRIMRPFIRSRPLCWAQIALVAVLLLLSILLAAVGLVPLKTLPFDNKNEFQVVIDMPEGTTLEHTDEVARRVESYLATVPEVTDFSAFVGIGSPMDFNGMVRHYYLRGGAHVADVRVNLVNKDFRQQQSHALVLRLRRDLGRIGAETGGSLKLVEVPPGPPVIATITAEVYGEPHMPYSELIAAARALKARLAEERGVVDLDDSVEADQRKLVFATDREKAGLSGVATAEIAQNLPLLLGGDSVGTVHVASERNELPIVLRLPREERSSPERLARAQVKGRTGKLVQLGEIGRFEERIEDKTIYHKNLERVAYVFADTAGVGPAYPILSMLGKLKKEPMSPGIRVVWNGEGEWKITLDVFRDLGLAFVAALVGIYVLLVYETRSYALPLIIMIAIPLTLIGIMPGFWILNILTNRPVGGFENPVFFTATAMIGMIALAGIVVRNSIILIDFIHAALAEGKTLAEGILQAGAVRLRPILLTAGTTMLGAWPITLDPIFSGLAWSFIFGLFVSTAFTLVVIPTVYYLIYGKTERMGSAQGGVAA